jgi:DeoR family transcriptional regulator, suf operon transcriptional repressor
MIQCINVQDLWRTMMTDPPAGHAATGYSSPKRGVLLHLKRHPDASLGELADCLGISKVAALGHLEKLESDRLVERSYRAGKVGRPRVLFRLAPSALTLFPQGYSEMSICALAFIEQRLGRSAVSELLDQRAHEVEDRNAGRVRSGTLADRVRELARIRSEGGYMAEMGPRRKGSIEMLEHNCPILALAQRFPEACEVERRMFESLLRARVEVSHRVVAGDPVCRFLMRERATRA